MTVAQLTGVVYSQSTVYSGTTAADYAGMNDGTANATGTGQAGTGASVPGWIMADCGALKFIGHIVLGYDYLSTIPGGFGVGHLQTSKVQVSSDGSAWTDLGYVPIYSTSGSTDGLVPVNIGRTARYVRIYKENPYIGLTEFQVWGGAFIPTDYSGCTVWLDASQLGLAADASLGSTWPDLSGNNHHGAVVGSPSPVVKNNAPFGKPVVRFKANEARVRGEGMFPAETPNSSFTVIYVGRQWGPNIGRIFSTVYPPFNLLVGTHVSGRNSCYDAGWINSGVAWTEPYNQWTTWGFVYHGSPNWGTFFVDGVESGANAGGGGHDHRWSLSGHSDTGAEETCDCEVAELICYDRDLTTTERQQVENYLYAKWFVSPPVPVDAPLSGSGTLSATRSQKYSLASSHSGAGTLTSTVVGVGARSAALHSTGQLQANVTVAGVEPPGGGSGWTANPSPSLPVRKYGPSWTEAATGNQRPQRGGWFALLEKVAEHEGEGVLSAVVAPHTGIQAQFSGNGQIAPALVIRNWRDALFSAEGRSFPDGFETRSRTANFTGGGALGFAMNDGLSAIASGQYPARLSAGGSLVAEITGGISYPDGLSAIAVGQYLIPAYFSSTGALLTAVKQIQAALATMSSTGTLSATAVGTGAVEVLANLLGTGAISATAFAQYLTSLGVSGAGTLTAALIASYQRAASGGGTGTMAATAYPRYLVSAGASGTGSLSATATIAFNPFTETNTNRTNQPVPVGTSGCWVTLVGGGNSGGTGRGAVFANCGGGGGGGGGGVLARSWIPVTSLGSTYTVVKGGAAQASSFSSGGKSVTANAGGVGANGGSSGAAAGGTGGTVSVTGFTGLTTFTGGAGGNGGTAGGNNGTAGANQTNTTAGGGGGAGRGSAGQTASGGKGGNSATANGGSANGGDGAAASAGNPGGGGGGGQSTNGTGGSGGDGGIYGAGGGGGGGGNSTGPAGPGSAGGSIVEWQ